MTESDKQSEIHHVSGRGTTEEYREALKKKVMLTQQEIADGIGKSQSYIHYVLNGDRMPSTSTAVKLEEVTGMCRESWLWPERHWNPYIPLGNAIPCLSCPNRVTRVRKVGAEMVKHVANHKDKEQGLRDAVTIGYICNGFSDGIALAMREMTSEGARLIHAEGRDVILPKVVKREHVPWLYGKMERGETVCIPHFPYDLPDIAVKEKEFLKGHKVRGAIVVSSGRLSMALATYKHYVLFDDELIEGVEHLIRELDKASR